MRGRPRVRPLLYGSPLVGVIGSTASEISAEVRSGRCSAEAVVREHLDVISAQGEITTYGSAAVSSGTAATSDHPVVARLRAAGAIVVGITRVPELCLFAFTDGPDAVTRNPWDPARTSGGSSGGSATAVAAGMVPIAHGADGLGSLRIPAACCGLVTLKPGLGTVPAGLGVGDWYGMAENGILATTVQDLALGHSVLAGKPVPDLATGAHQGLRIGTSVRSPLVGAPPDVDSRAAVDRAAAALAVAAADAQDIGADPPRLQPRTRRHAQLGRLATRLGLVRPGPVVSFRQRLRTLFQDLDVLITPMLTGPPLRAEDWHWRAWMPNVLASSRFAAYPAVWNLAGYPAMSIPV